MNKLFFIIIGLVFLSGCGDDRHRDYQNPGPIQQISFYSEPQEFCYQGVVYVRFGSGNYGWGSVKFTKEGKLVSCQ